MTDNPISMAWFLTMKSFGLIRGTYGAASSASRKAKSMHSQASLRRTVHTSQAAMARGFLAPGDPPPIGGGRSFLDYRGIACASDLGPLAATVAGGFPAGRLQHPAQGAVARVTLPLDLLRRHAAVIGGAGNGKTAGIIVPWICAALAAGHTVIATDVKGDLHDDVLAFARRYHGHLGARVAKWDLTDPTHSVKWDWLAELVDDGTVDAAVTAILGRENKQSAQDPFFYRRDATLLRGLLRVAPTVFPGGPTARDLFSLLTNRQQIEGLMAHAPKSPGVDEITTVLGGADPSEYGKLTNGVSTALSKLVSPGFIGREPQAGDQVG